MAQPTLQEVEQLATQLSPADRIYRAARLMRWGPDAASVNAGSKPLVSLRDKFAGAVPDDFDIDEALRECRTEWLKEIDAVVGGGEIP